MGMIGEESRGGNHQGGIAGFLAPSSLCLAIIGNHWGEITGFLAPGFLALGFLAPGLEASEGSWRQISQKLRVFLCFEARPTVLRARDERRCHQKTVYTAT